jgi:hypothetical protein
LTDPTTDIPPHQDPRFIAAVAAMQALIVNHDIPAAKAAFREKHGGDPVRGHMAYRQALVGDAVALADTLLVHLQVTPGGEDR